ncbi:DUF3352 domain-containing protein [Pedobacter mendelii]|uniref:DUF3352 domain-containing protein n=1 Tax=Pedobacter mendelii TaxID=1908240 RepID=A0ABQ2BNQ7_9SPHI|nr:DUF3352 domain-containing protein [Pedobacter mendelii]GGI28567.1 hypothetical protein GCM10008119_33290 [Pedobacter mendelii]
MRKILVLLIALIAGVAFMAYLYFSKLNNENNAKDLALQSATNNASVIFAFQNDKSFYQIIEGQGLLQQVLGTQKTSFLRNLKESIVNDNALNGFIVDEKIYLSILPDEQKELNFLITTQILVDKDFKQLNQLLNKETELTAIKKDVYKINFNDSLSIFIGVQNQVLTASTSLKLIDDASIRLTENPFTDYINKNNLLNKNVLAHLYLNFNHAPEALKKIIAGNLNGEISFLNKQNSFASLTYNFSKEKILFSGTSEFVATDNYLKIFENDVPQAISITNLLPNNTANYSLFAYSDYKLWNKKLNNWQLLIQETNKTEGTINSVKNNYRVDLKSIFLPYVKNQFISFQLSTTEKLGAITLSNGEKVKQLLLDVSADYSDEIKIFKSPNILYSFFGEPFKKFERPYYTIVDNNLVFANNVSTVQSFLNSYKNNKLLIQDASYQDALNQLSTTSNISYYINLKNSADIFRSNITLPYYKHLKAEGGLKSFDTFYYQMIADKDKFITNMLLNKYLELEIPDSLSNR